MTDPTLRNAHRVRTLVAFTGSLILFACSSPDQGSELTDDTTDAADAANATADGAASDASRDGGVENDAEAAEGAAADAASNADVEAPGDAESPDDAASPDGTLRDAEGSADGMTGADAAEDRSIPVDAAADADVDSSIDSGVDATGPGLDAAPADAAPDASPVSADAAPPPADAALLDATSTADAAASPDASDATADASGDGPDAAVDAAPAPNLVQDGDFSDPPESSWAFFSDTTMGAWTAGGTGQYAVGLFPQGNTTLPPGATGQTCWLANADLNGTANGSVSQDVPTVVGHRYQLTFNLANDPYWTTDGTPLTVLWEGATVANLMSPSGGTSVSGDDSPIEPAWTTATLTLTATTTSSALEFFAPTLTTNDFVGINDVVLVDLGP